MQQCKVIYFLKLFLNLLLPGLFQYFLLRKRNHTYMQDNCLCLKKSYSILRNDATSIFNQLQVVKKQEKKEEPEEQTALPHGLTNRSILQNNSVILAKTFTIILKIPGGDLQIK